MNVQQLARSEGFRALTLPTPEREIQGVYIGDLLSWVMGRATENDAWITIMSNTNIVAVATLADIACIILAEGVTLEDEVMSVAEAKGVNILTSPLSAYEVARLLGTMGL